MRTSPATTPCTPAGALPVIAGNGLEPDRGDTTSFADHLVREQGMAQERGPQIATATPARSQPDRNAATIGQGSSRTNERDADESIAQRLDSTARAPARVDERGGSPADAQDTAGSNPFVRQFLPHARTHSGAAPSASDSAAPPASTRTGHTRGDTPGCVPREASWREPSCSLEEGVSSAGGGAGGAGGRMTAAKPGSGAVPQSNTARAAVSRGAPRAASQDRPGVNGRAAQPNARTAHHMLEAARRADTTEPIDQTSDRRTGAAGTAVQPVNAESTGLGAEHGDSAAVLQPVPESAPEATATANALSQGTSAVPPNPVPHAMPRPAIEIAEAARWTDGASASGSASAEPQPAAGKRSAPPTGPTAWLGAADEATPGTPAWPRALDGTAQGTSSRGNEPAAPHTGVVAGSDAWRAVPAWAGESTPSPPGRGERADDAPAPSAAAGVDAAGIPAGFAPVLRPADGGLQVALATPVESPKFHEALGVQVSVLARDGVQHAELHLNPAEMGPISVQIAVDGQQAQIHFGSDSAQTRQIVESSLPALAAALRDAGLTLSGGGVSQHAPGSRNAKASTLLTARIGRADELESQPARRIAIALGRLDTYA